jgi:membrane dipeptidase
MSFREQTSLGPSEARQLHAEALVIDSKYSGTLSVPSPRVSQFFEEHLQNFGKPGGLDRRTIEARTKDLAARELWESADVRKAYINQWKQVGVNAGLASVGLVSPPGEDAYVGCMSLISRDIYAPVLTSNGQIRVALSAADIEQAHETGTYALIVGCENSTPVSPHLDRIDHFYNLGMRYMQLTYNLRNLVGDGCTEGTDGGLSKFGHAFVERLNEKRMIVDVSHSGTRTAMDAIGQSKQPVCLSHGSAKTVYAHDRASDDAVLKAVADGGGYIGVYVVPGFLQGNREAHLDQWAEHLEYIVRLAGIDAVGIGTDLGEVNTIPAELATFETHYPPGGFPWHGFTRKHQSYHTRMHGFRNLLDWPNLTVHLAKRGFKEDEIRKIIGLNFLRFFREVVG